jgi:hypothetical protein
MQTVSIHLIPKLGHLIPDANDWVLWLGPRSTAAASPQSQAINSPKTLVLFGGVRILVGFWMFS